MTFALVSGRCLLAGAWSKATESVDGTSNGIAGGTVNGIDHGNRSHSDRAGATTTALCGCRKTKPRLPELAGRSAGRRPRAVDPRPVKTWGRRRAILPSVVLRRGGEGRATARRDGARGG